LKSFCANCAQCGRPALADDLADANASVSADLADAPARRPGGRRYLPAFDDPDF
jgi:hypothetical protein